MGKNLVCILEDTARPLRLLGLLRTSTESKYHLNHHLDQNVFKAMDEISTWNRIVAKYQSIPFYLYIDFYSGCHIINRELMLDCLLEV